MYVDDLNLVGTPEELIRTTKIFDKGILDKRSWKNKILSQPTNRAFPYLTVDSPINIY